MGISGIRAAENMTVRQPRTTEKQQADPVSKNIRNEISDAQRQKQSLSSKEDISADEKMQKRRELQQEISSLNVKLRQRELEERRQEQRESRLDELQGDDRNKETQTPKITVSGADNSRIGGSDAGTGKTDADRTETEKDSAVAADRKKEEEKTSAARSDMSDIVRAESDIRQAKTQNAVITRMRDGIVTLKGEIRQDEMRGEDTEQKKSELARQEAKLQRVSTEQLPNPGKADNTRQAANQAKMDALSVKTASPVFPNNENQHKVIVDANIFG